jgi:hypothetical protein
MPNDCYNLVRISGDEATIKTIKETKFSFQALYPCPHDENNNDTTIEWRTENWGTKWDRYNFRIITEGTTGLEFKFSTAWAPPYDFFTYLLKKYPDLWLRCDWSEEGGMAGVFVGYMKEGELKIKELTWEDWCLEEWAHRFNNKGTILPRQEEYTGIDEYIESLKKVSEDMKKKEMEKRKLYDDSIKHSK